MSTMQLIEAKAKSYAQARDKLAEIVTTLHDGMEALKRSHMADLKKAINRAAETSDALRALVEASPELFEKPKTAIFHGIRVGFQKGKGKISWDDAEEVVRLIHKHFPDELDDLITTTEKPAKEGLNELTAAQLKKLGITVDEGGNAVFIKPVDSAVDKMVKALLKGVMDEQEAEA